MCHKLRLCHAGAPDRPPPLAKKSNSSAVHLVRSVLSRFPSDWLHFSHSLVLVWTGCHQNNLQKQQNSAVAILGNSVQGKVFWTSKFVCLPHEGTTPTRQRKLREFGLKRNSSSSIWFWQLLLVYALGLVVPFSGLFLGEAEQTSKFQKTSASQREADPAKTVHWFLLQHPLPYRAIGSLRMLSVLSIGSVWNGSIADHCAWVLVAQVRTGSSKIIARRGNSNDHAQLPFHNDSEAPQGRGKHKGMKLIDVIIGPGHVVGAQRFFARFS